MPKSYSGDLRERVIEAVEIEGASRREAAERFGVSVSSGVRWLQRWNESGSAAPKPRGGSVSPLEAHEERILALIAERPDLTLLSCSSGGFEPAGVHFRGFLVDMASPSKKSLQAAERQRSDVARARRRWIREQGMLDPARLVALWLACATTE